MSLELHFGFVFRTFLEEDVRGEKTWVSGRVGAGEEELNVRMFKKGKERNLNKVKEEIILTQRVVPTGVTVVFVNIEFFWLLMLM